MEPISVITMTDHQLEAIIDKKIDKLQDVIRTQSKIPDPLMDIASLKANLKWSDGKARRLVKEGRLQPEFTGNSKTMFFRLSKCTHL